MVRTLVISPVFSPLPLRNSYGYRPKRSAQDAVICINGYLKMSHQPRARDADLSKRHYTAFTIYCDKVRLQSDG